MKETKRYTWYTLLPGVMFDTYRMYWNYGYTPMYEFSIVRCGVKIDKISLDKPTQ